MSDSLYQKDLLLDHARNPRNFCVLDNPSVTHYETNPLCGDKITVYLDIDKKNNSLKRMTYETSGCVISRAAASLLSEAVSGKGNESIESMQREDLEKILGTTLSLARVKCGMLPLIALQKALEKARCLSCPFSSECGVGND